MSGVPFWWQEEKAKAEERAREIGPPGKDGAKKGGPAQSKGPDDHAKQRTPRCRVCEHPKMFCVCSALQLWQDENDLPQPTIPFARQKPDGKRHDGFPHPDCDRGVGRDMDGDMLPHRDDILWLPTLTNDTHYGKESEYLRKMIEIAHHDPPELPEPGKSTFMVNHAAVQHSFCFLLDRKCDPNIEYVDPTTGRFETPLHCAASLAAQHTKGAIVTVMNCFVQYETYLFSTAQTGLPIPEISVVVNALTHAAVPRPIRRRGQEGSRTRRDCRKGAAGKDCPRRRGGHVQEGRRRRRRRPAQLVTLCGTGVANAKNWRTPQSTTRGRAR